MILSPVASSSTGRIILFIAFDRCGPLKRKKAIAEIKITADMMENRLVRLSRNSLSRNFIFIIA
jgi:hypothetical protein